MNIFYYDMRNFGDGLNKTFIEKFYGKEPKVTTPADAEYTGIGSILGRFLNASYKDKKVKVLGSGFMTDFETRARKFDRDMDFVAVRGKLTLAKINEVSGNKIDCALGDAGIFVDEWFNTHNNKKHKMGIIPHFIDKDSPIIQSLPEDILLIDVMGDRQKFIDDICSCEFVLSSTLHGLIACDSLRVPNRHIILGNKVLGGEFKFKDYYSVYGVYQEPLRAIGTTEYIITDDMVKKYKQGLREALDEVL